MARPGGTGHWLCTQAGSRTHSGIRFIKPTPSCDLRRAMTVTVSHGHPGPRPGGPRRSELGIPSQVTCHPMMMTRPGGDHGMMVGHRASD